MRATKIKRWAIGLLLLGSMVVMVLAGGLASAGQGLCYKMNRTSSQICTPGLPGPNCIYNPTRCEKP